MEERRNRKLALWALLFPVALSICVHLLVAGTGAVVVAIRKRHMPPDPPAEPIEIEFISPKPEELASGPEQPQAEDPNTGITPLLQPIPVKPEAPKPEAPKPEPEKKTQPEPDKPTPPKPEVPEPPKPPEKFKPVQPP